MGDQLAMKPAYSYGFNSDELKPLVETQSLNREDMLSFIKEKDISESLQTGMKDESVSLAEVQDDINDATSVSSSAIISPTEKEHSEDKRYALTYYNPSTGKSEVLAITSSIKIKDYTQKIIEEAVGMQSAYTLYSYIVSPVLTTEINPYKLQEIKDNIEYVTPPKFGGVAMVKPSKRHSQVIAVDSREAARSAFAETIKRKEVAEKQLEEKIVVPEKIVKPAKHQSQIVAVDSREAIQGAFAESIKRKNVAEKEVEKEIVVLEKAVEELKVEHDAEKAVEQLPALSKIRFMTVIRRKHLSERALLGLLERDVSFLKTIKKKLKLMSLDELLDIARSIKKLKEKN